MIPSLSHGYPIIIELITPSVYHHYPISIPWLSHHYTMIIPCSWPKWADFSSPSSLSAKPHGSGQIASRRGRLRLARGTAQGQESPVPGKKGALWFEENDVKSWIIMVYSWYNHYIMVLSTFQSMKIASEDWDITLIYYLYLWFFS